MDISQVETGLWLGAMPRIVPRGVDAIVNLVSWGEPALGIPELQFVRLLLAPILDGPFPGIAWLDSTVDTVLRWRQEGLRVLVACAAGRSRCALVTTAVMMKLHGWAADGALDWVRQARPVANPNLSFRVGLRDYQAFLAASQEVTKIG
jgi:protein-tyrosine phosphatase